MKDMMEAGVFDPYLVKHWGIKLATNAAITVLRVDQVSHLLSIYLFLSVQLFLFRIYIGCFLDYNVICVCQIIMAKPAGGPRAPKQQGHWDKDDYAEEPEKFDTHH